MTTAPVQPWPGGGYALRPIMVITDLDELRGPLRGVFALPLHLNASVPRCFDFNAPSDRLVAYQLVLLEAASREDLTRWLDRRELERLWPDLYLPRRERPAWQQAHAALRCVGAGPGVPWA